MLKERLVPIWPVWYPKLNNDLYAEKGKLQASYCARCNIRSGFLQDLIFPKPHCSSWTKRHCHSGNLAIVAKISYSFPASHKQGHRYSQTFTHISTSLHDCLIRHEQAYGPIYSLLMSNPHLVLLQSFAVLIVTLDISDITVGRARVAP